MAGNWVNMTNHDGTPYDANFGYGSIRETANGEDVVETLEECYGMIWWLAQRLSEWDKDPFSREDKLRIIAEAQAGAKEGAEIGRSIDGRGLCKTSSPRA